MHKIGIIAAILGAAVSAPAWSGELNVPNRFQAGDPAVADQVNANFDAAAQAVTDNATRIETLESAVGIAPDAGAASPLTLELNSSSLAALRGVEGGGVMHYRGTSPAVRPVTVRGLPGPLSELLGLLADSIRFSGRLLRINDVDAQPLVSIEDVWAEELNVPAVGEGSGAFLVEVVVSPDSADVGPFPTEQIDAPDGAATFEAELQVTASGLGPVTAHAAEPVTYTNVRGGRPDVPEDPRISFSRDDLEVFTDPFNSGTRLSDIRLTYRRPDGSTALEITAATGYVVVFEPAYDGTGAVELQLDDPGLTGY